MLTTHQVIVVFWLWFVLIPLMAIESDAPEPVQRLYSPHLGRDSILGLMRSGLCQCNPSKLHVQYPYRRANDLCYSEEESSQEESSEEESRASC